jgi:hypothetical protein
MKYICPKCNRISVDGNLWCQEKYCPAENTLQIFDSGEWFGNVEIVETLTILRSSAIYKARRDDKKILIKVAHPGFEERLKRESSALLDLSRHGQHAMLPTLLPAHEQAALQQFPYGKIVYAGKIRYYSIYDHVDGDILRYDLLKNPQPWYQHVGWLMISLSDVLVLLHQKGFLHLCLCPEVVMTRFDKQKIPRPTLLDLGISCTPEQVSSMWDPIYAIPAYTPPELIKMKGNVGPRSDVYGLGLMLFEMLTGSPAYEYRLKKDEEVYQEILSGSTPSTGRVDLKNIPQIAEKAIQRLYTNRYEDVLSFAKDLHANFPLVPKEKKGFKINWRTVAIVIGAALILSLLLVFAAIPAK